MVALEMQGQWPLLLLALLAFSPEITAFRQTRIRGSSIALGGSGSFALKATLEPLPTATLNEMPSLEELQKILEVADIAARKAGVLIRDNIGARVKYSKTNYKVRIVLCMTHQTTSLFSPLITLLPLAKWSLCRMW